MRNGKIETGNKHAAVARDHSNSNFLFRISHFADCRGLTFHANASDRSHERLIGKALVPRLQNQHGLAPVRIRRWSAASSRDVAEAGSVLC